MMPDLEHVLGELDGHPTTQLTLSASRVEYRQALGWYWEVRRNGLVLKHGVQTEPRTRVEIEDLLATLERNTKNV